MVDDDANNLQDDSVVNDNDNAKRKKRLSHYEVDELANYLNSKYGGNGDYFRFYCKCIWKLGKQRVLEREGRVRDAKPEHSGRMLSKILKDDLNQVEGSDRLRKLKDKFDEKKNE